MAAWNMACSTIAWSFPARAAGCFRQSTFNQCYYCIVSEAQVLTYSGIPQSINLQTFRLPGGANLQHWQEGIFRKPSA
jgi:hypothetical protein